MKRTLLFTLALMASGCGPLPPDGPYETYYYFQRQLKLKGTYKGGELDGPYERYFKNGQLKERGTYKRGELDGLYELYFDNGLLQAKFTHVAGELDGPYENYSRNGQLALKGTFNMGVGCGEWINPYRPPYAIATLRDPCPPGN